MNKLNLDKDTIPENYVFIVDNITSAFAIATWAAGKTISCIYECKIIDWRKADYNALFDIILSDVKKINRVSVEVPHPYFMHSPNIFMTIWKQKKFIKNVRKIFKLDKSKTYVSCSTSSILISKSSCIRETALPPPPPTPTTFIFALNSASAGKSSILGLTALFLFL